jgi:hypothetical protein
MLETPFPMLAKRYPAQDLRMHLSWCAPHSLMMRLVKLAGSEVEALDQITDLEQA